jgi:hypothetical protein
MMLPAGSLDAEEIRIRLSAGNFVGALNHKL